MVYKLGNRVKVKIYSPLGSLLESYEGIIVGFEEDEDGKKARIRLPSEIKLASLDNISKI